MMAITAPMAATNAAGTRSARCAPPTTGSVSETNPASDAVSTSAHPT